MQRNSHKHHGRHLSVLLFCICWLIPHNQVLAQSKPEAAGKSPLCTREIALDMIKQQVDLTKTYTDTIRRIAFLIRAADILWPYQQDKARAVFTEAFALATAVETEKQNDPKRSSSLLLRMQVPDQRYVVVRAIARKDSAWAKELVRQTMNGSEASRNSFDTLVNSSRLLDIAYNLIGTDINAAVDLARASLNYQAGPFLTRFLFRFAEVDQLGADQFYAQALGVYAERPFREFLYLQSYPFAWRETVNTPIFLNDQVPANFRTNPSLQRRFLQVLLRRAQQALESPVDEGDTYRNQSGTYVPATVQVLQGLIRLEPQVRATLPDFVAPLTQTRERILVSLSVEMQQQLLQPGREISTKQQQTFDEEVELALKAADADERDGLIVTALFGANKENLEKVIQVIDKISDSILRAHVFEWFYFKRAVAAVKDKQFPEAERLTTKVEGQEKRAYLHTEIAKALLNRSDSATHAQELLEEAIREAKRVGTSIFAARTLLTVSTLYAKIDLNRSIAVLADAINGINRIEAPDFFSDDQTLENKPERRGRGGEYQGEYDFNFYMPGLDPESAFHEMAKLDFDTSLSQSSALTDKFQRGISILALADVCLQQTLQQPKKGRTKSAKP